MRDDRRTNRPGIRAGKDPRRVIVDLMTRERKHELEDSWV